MDKETWLLWMLADSQLPTGGFVASAGLEAAVQGGLVRENVGDDHEDAFTGFIHNSTRNQARFALPFCSQVHDQVAEQLALLDREHEDSSGSDSAVAEGILDGIRRIDAYHHAMLASNRVAMRASIAQGGGLLSLFNRGYAHAGLMAGRRGSVCEDVAKRLQRLARLGEIRGHWATTFGFVCAALGISCAHTQQVFLFQFVRQVFSAAVRLNLVGPLRAQTLTCDAQQLVSLLLEQHGQRRVAFGSDDDVFGESAVYTEPMLELFQGMHDRLYSRIFNS
ncbi:hypothetical protein LPJ73_000096 [Coemansia sp. RSA 2703]|nr:hypothetical protein LPJ73_000096 [Coemansia sp. RSA 2703]KAJ2379468.1 hypothetical protein IW150_000149 [Coemansia sp. RSA 2607]KAJ2398376.1 hypothetical protein GGI05_000122 [Coemansia sp. RSA 2603]